ncbi:uncharacterized protein [Erythrolamprus reginae]|uniref:uncharacterized protein n=1 Tax=Erythrolamprus reginae TaxID=121349 RepID=UPI00396C2E08
MAILRGSSVGASSHSLKFFSTAILKPSQGEPQFVSVGYVDDQLFSVYDSNSRKMQPRVPWMEKLGKEDPQYRETEKEVLHLTEEAFEESLEILRSRYNQSKGLHTLQGMYGCELSAEGRKRGFNQYGHDGKTFITFNMETFTWVALDPMAQITQRKWDANPGYNQRKKVYLEEICIKCLEKYLSYQKEALQTIEPPVVTVSSKPEVEDEMETHVCRVDGFYPREIDASWTRDGEVWLEDTFHGSVAPNADGTYHYWLSIRIDPEERGHYQCHVEHDGLQDPLDMALKDSKFNLGLISICIVPVVIIMIAGIAGICLYKRRQSAYKAASTFSGTREVKPLGLAVCSQDSKIQRTPERLRPCAVSQQLCLSRGLLKPFSSPSFQTCRELQGTHLLGRRYRGRQACRVTNLVGRRYRGRQVSPSVQAGLSSFMARFRLHIWTPLGPWSVAHLSCSLGTLDLKVQDNSEGEAEDGGEHRKVAGSGLEKSNLEAGVPAALPPWRTPQTIFLSFFSDLQSYRSCWEEIPRKAAFSGTREVKPLGLAVCSQDSKIQRTPERLRPCADLQSTAWYPLKAETPKVMVSSTTEVEDRMEMSPCFTLVFDWDEKGWLQDIPCDSEDEGQPEHLGVALKEENDLQSTVLYHYCAKKIPLKADLQRTARYPSSWEEIPWEAETPEVMASSITAVENGMEMYSCLIHYFDWDEEGWLRDILCDSEDEGQPEHLDVALKEEKGSNQAV